MKKFINIAILTSVILVVLSFTALNTPNFVSLDFKVSNGCSTGFSNTIEYYNTFSGYYNFQYDSCGYEKPIAIYEIAFPDEVKEIIETVDSKAKTCNGKCALEFNVGKYNCSATIQDSLNYEYNIYH